MSSGSANNNKVSFFDTQYSMGYSPSHGAIARQSGAEHSVSSGTPYQGPTVDGPVAPGGPDVDQTLVTIFALLGQILELLKKTLEQDGLAPDAELSRESTVDKKSGVKEQVTPEFSSLSDGLSLPGSAKPKDPWGGLYAPKRVFNQVYNNSTYVAVIKAAMMRFGQSPTAIFKKITPVANGCEITMRDSFKLALSHEELKRAAEASNFLGNDRQMIDDADLLFCAFVKRKQLESSDLIIRRSFDAALATSVRGEHLKRALLGLGLVGHMRPADAAVMEAKDVVGVLHSHYYESVAVIDGAMDAHGVKGDVPYRGYGYVLV